MHHESCATALKIFELIRLPLALRRHGLGCPFVYPDMLIPVRRLGHTSSSECRFGQRDLDLLWGKICNRARVLMLTARNVKIEVAIKWWERDQILTD